MNEWEANTGYVVGQIVRPTADADHLFRATVAGTSGGTEPTWVHNALVTDGTVTWHPNTAFRTQVQNGLKDLLDDFQEANPTLLRAVWTARPASFSVGELPCAYIDRFNESATHANGIRQRRISPTVTLVDVAPDSQEAESRMTLLVDALWDVFTAGFHSASATSILTPTSVVDDDTGDVEEGGVHYVSNTFVFAETYVAEGRS